MVFADDKGTKTGICGVSLTETIFLIGIYSAYSFRC